MLKEDPDETPEQPERVRYISGGTLALSFGTMLFGTCLADQCVVDGIEYRLTTINETLQEQRSSPELIQENVNVIGGPAVESFYEINGQRAYIIVDGQPVEFYHPEGLPAR